MSLPPKDFKDTLQLPRTDFPLHWDFARLEPSLLAWWAERRIHARLLEKNAGAEPFVLADGPLYAERRLHPRHALNKVLKDIVVKYRNLAGRRCDFIPGWDAHALAIEQEVAKRLADSKVDRSTLSRDALLEQCRAQVLELIDRQQAALQRLGVFGSWESAYRTLDFAYEAQVLRELAMLARRGLVYRGRKRVSWCVNDQMALAPTEVYLTQRTSPSVYVALRAGPEVAGKFPLLKGREVCFVAWTSAPWKLPACLAIAVDPDAEYVFYETGSRVICVAKELLAQVLAEVKADELVLKNARLPGGDVETVGFDDPRKILAYASGEELEHLTWQHPFLERTGPVVSGAHVTLKEGTGLVPIAPAHGHEDAEVGLKYGLAPYSPVRVDGRYDETVGPALQGLRVLEADPAIVDLLAQRGALLGPKTDTVERTHPHCLACNQPVIVSTMPHWFIALDRPLADGQTLRQRVLEEVDRVKWMPEQGHHIIRGLLEERPDWCISRRRGWGVPLPIAACDGCGEVVVSPEVMERAAAAVEKEGAGVWYRTPVKEFLGADARCASCGGSEFRREVDVLVAEFGSACMFPAVLERRQRSPADLCLEGSEQLHGWFQSSLLVSVGTRDVAPFRACLTHGSVVYGGIDRISRSQESILDPGGFRERYGVELLRLWMAASDSRRNARPSRPLFHGLSRHHAKIRNTLRYALGNLFDFNPTRDAVPASELLPLDAWARGRLAEVVARVRQAYEDCEFRHVYTTVVDFCARDLSALYFDILKDRLYMEKATGRARRSAQTVLHEVASTLPRLLAPVLSFTAEEAWQQLPGRTAESVFLAGFPQPEGAMEPALAERYAKLFAVRSAVQGVLEAARREKRIGASPGARLVLTASGKARDFLQANLGELPSLLIVSQVELAEQPGPRARSLPLAQALGEGETVTAEVLPAKGAKCPRCRVSSEEVGQGSEVCPRCREALGGG